MQEKQIKPFSTEDLNVFAQMLRHAAQLYPDYEVFYTKRADEIEIEYLTQIRQAINAKIDQLQEVPQSDPKEVFLGDPVLAETDYALTAAEESGLIAQADANE